MDYLLRTAVRVIMITLLLGGLPAGLVMGTEEASQGAQLELTETSIEDLMNIQVTSVSKRPQKLSDAAAAVFVITRDDIRRSGATSIPEILRMAPGVQVAKIDSNQWAISIRGFNSRFANKLLVLIDGRSVYTPFFSGTYWDVQDTVIEDIDRIEVIRGPGATLWGANAVNGVINIITKHTQESQGGLLVAGTGVGEERGFGALRYGARVGDDTYYRFYFKGFDRDNGVNAAGDKGADAWNVLRGGFRVDSEKTGRDTLTLQGDIYKGKEGEVFTVPLLEPPYSETMDSTTNVGGGNLLTRWKRKFSSNSDMALQLYYDRTERDTALFGETRDTTDVDFQNRVMLGDSNEIVWGLGYRFSHSGFDNKRAVTFTPDRRNDEVFSAFIQDDIAVVKDQVHLIVGSKFEHNNFTGVEIQPNTRLIWTPDNSHTLWAAASRAVRTPSIADETIRNEHTVYPPGTFGPSQVLPVLNVVRGSDKLDSEELMAYEVGYRIKPAEHFSVDIAAFYNMYRRLRTLENGTPFLNTSSATLHIENPISLDEKMNGETSGAELSADWSPLESLRFRAAYSLLEVQMHPDPDNNNPAYKAIMEEDNPRHQASLRSSISLVKDVEFDMWVRYVDRIYGINDYVTLDSRLAWNPLRNLELSLAGRNLLDNQHPEFREYIINTTPTEVVRSFYGKITWRF